MSVVPIHRYIERPADSVTNAQDSTSYTYDNNGLRIRKSIGLAGGATTANVSYTWLVASGRYKGLVVRTANANGVKTSEATRLLVNGQ